MESDFTPVCVAGLPTTLYRFANVNSVEVIELRPVQLIHY